MKWSSKTRINFIDDFLSDLLELEAVVENDIVNIGAGTDHSIREFAGLICEIVDFDPEKIKYDETRYVGAKSKVLDCAKVRSVVQNFHRTELKEGLRQTIKWMQAQMAVH